MRQERAGLSLIARASILASVLVLGCLLPSYAGTHSRHHGKQRGHKHERTKHGPRDLIQQQRDDPPGSLELFSGDPELRPYAGVGSWIDIYNRGPWTYPAKTINRMKAQGVRTIYLQTANYGASRAIVHERMTARIIEMAHGRGMHVVAWYVPAFKRLKNDYHRTMAAIRFRTPTGQAFDSFAMDIEATVVGNVATRSKRMLTLSRRVRHAVGKDYALGAIIPDPAGALYWPDFPYASVARLYDVFVPMGYFTYRTSGYHRVHDYTDANISIIRRETGDVRIPIHVIGGEADDAPLKEVKAFVASARQKKVLGLSLYDYPITDELQFKALREFGDKPPHRTKPSPKPSPTETAPGIPSPPAPPPVPDVIATPSPAPSVSLPSIYVPSGAAGAIARAILSL